MVCCRSILVHASCLMPGSTAPSQTTAGGHQVVVSNNRVTTTIMCEGVVLQGMNAAEKRGASVAGRAAARRRPQHPSKGTPSTARLPLTFSRLPRRRRERSVASMRPAGTARVSAAAAAPAERPSLVRLAPAGACACVCACVCWGRGRRMQRCCGTLASPPSPHGFWALSHAPAHRA